MRCNIFAFYDEQLTITGIDHSKRRGNTCPWGKPTVIGAGAAVSEYIETVIVPEIFATEIADIQRVGGICRLVLTVPQSIHGEGETRVVVAKLLVETSTIPRMIEALVSAGTGQIPTGPAQ